MQHHIEYVIHNENFGKKSKVQQEILFFLVFIMIFVLF